MADFQFWLYVIVGIIYLLSRLGKKKQAEGDLGPTPESGPTTSQPQGERQMTFEELLQEITKAKTPVIQPKPEPVVTSPQPVNYDSALGEEEEDLEEVEYDYKKKDKIYDVYEKAKQDAFNRPSYEEVDWHDQKNDLVFEKFQGFREEEKPDLMQLYLSDLKNPDGLKKAFVVSEVLRPKF